MCTIQHTKPHKKCKRSNPNKKRKRSNPHKKCKQTRRELYRQYKADGFTLKKLINNINLSQNLAGRSKLFEKIANIANRTANGRLEHCERFKYSDAGHLYAIAWTTSIAVLARHKIMITKENIGAQIGCTLGEFHKLTRGRRYEVIDKSKVFNPAQHMHARIVKELNRIKHIFDKDQRTNNKSLLHAKHSVVLLKHKYVKITKELLCPNCSLELKTRKHKMQTLKQYHTNIMVASSIIETSELVLQVCESSHRTTIAVFEAIADLYESFIS